MSDANVLTFPEDPDEYFNYGSYLEPLGSWKFGLPLTPGGTGSSCGAMPFRNGTGINSPNCLRGEDWVFMAEWAADRYNLTNNLLAPAANLQGPFDVIDSAPVRLQLANMYNNLAELKTVYGADFDLENQQVQYSSVDNVLMGGLDMTYSLDSRQPPLGDIPLERSMVQTFFTDMAKIKCTFARANHDSGTMAKQLYDWSKRDGEDAEETNGYIESMWLSGVPRNVNTQRPIQYDTQFIGLFYAREYVRDGSGTSTKNDDGYVLYKLGGKMALTQNMNAQNGQERFSVACNYGGASLAGDIARILGMEINPTVPENGEAWFTMRLDHLYAVAWPKYLQLS